MFYNFDLNKTISIAGTFAVIGTIVGWLPYFAALVAFLWYVIQLWESRTVQYWWNSRQMARRLRKIAKLKAREKIITARLIGLQTVHAAREEARTVAASAAIEATRLQVEEERKIIELKSSLRS